MPCAACVKRGAPETCQWQWADNTVDPLVLFSKLTGDIAELQARLSEVETYIKNSPAHPSPIASSIFSTSAANPGPATSAFSVRSSTFHSDPHKKDESVAESIDTSALFTPEQHLNQAATPMPPIKTNSILALVNQTIHPGNASRSNSGPQEAEYDAAAENAAIYLESFANQGPRGEDSTSPVSPQHLPATAVTNQNIVWQQDMELTEALTSIRDIPTKIQNEDVHLTWFPHSVDGLSYLSARTKALQEVYTYLPTAAQTEFLIQLFEEKVHWRFSIVHLPALRLEIKRLWEMIAAGRQLEVDPLWLGVLFMVLALGMNNHPTTPTPGNIFPGLTTEQISALATGYHSASLKALHIGDCMGKPRPRTVQSVCTPHNSCSPNLIHLLLSRAICLFAVYFQQFLQPAAGPSSAERMLHWLAIAIRSAQMLGLHTLGDNPEVWVSFPFQIKIRP